jgi:biopolymer transport protein TolR
MGVSLPGGGGKRGVDFDINLVPFIDLLSCLISFLLVTAVWTNLARIDVNQPMPSQNESETPPVEPTEARILIDKEGYLVHFPHEAVPRRIGLEPDGVTYKRAELAEGFKKMKEAKPNDTIKIKFASTDEAKFKEYIGVLDICLGLGLTDLMPTVAADLATRLTAAMNAGAPPSAP